MNDDELLSRWLEHDLPPAEAAALSQRLREEPALAARLEVMRGWIEALEALPEVAPPRALDARVLGRAPEPRVQAVAGAWAGWRPAAIGLLAAGLLGWVVQPDALQVTVEGAEVRAQGEGNVLIDGAELELSGRAQVVRSSPPVAGEIVVLVQQGSAVLRREGVELARLDAGERWQGERQPVAAPAVQPAAPTGALANEVQRLRAELAAVKAELEQVRVLGVVAEGQLVATRGEPVPWPSSVLPGLLPDALQASVLDALDAVDQIALEDLDCSEYPCLALLRVDAAEPLVHDLVTPVVDAVTQGVPGATVSVWSHHFRGAGGGVSLVSFAVAPSKDLHRDGVVGVRLAYRADTLATDHARDLVGP